MSLYLGNKKVSGLHIGSAAAGTTPIALAKPTINVNANTGVITATVTQSSAGYVNSGSSSNTLALTTKAATAITPNSTTQTAVAKNVYTLGAVTVKPVPTEEKTVTANGEYTPTSGKYFSKVKVNIDTGIAVNNQANKDVTPSTQTQTVQPDSGYTGLAQVTVNPIPSNYIIPSGNKEITANGTNISVAAYDTVTVNVSSSVNNEPSRTITPTTSKQTITPASGYSGLSQVVVNAMPSGTAGTPTATKGTVSNHSVTITPKVTNTTGYIVGNTKTGTAVTVSASELVDGTLSVTSNGTKDVTNYASINVNIPTGAAVNNQDKTVSPNETEQTITADSGYSGLGTVTVNAISSDYVGSGITTRSSADLTASGATVSVPAGYYSAAASKAVASGSAKTPATTITANPDISINSSGLITATTSASKNITPTVSAGYVSSGTAGTVTVSGSDTLQLTTLGAKTYNVSSSNQTITSGKYLTGTQTIRAVTTSNISAANIKAGVVVKVGDSADDDRITAVTGTFTSDATASAADINSGKTAYVNGNKITGAQVIQRFYTGSSAPTSSLGSNGDIYLQE